MRVSIVKMMAVFFAFFAAFPFLVPMTMGQEVPLSWKIPVVDEAKLSQRYQAEHWSGRRIVGFGHVAKVKDGVLFVDNQKSKYPADSSVANKSNPVYSDKSGTWFEDHENNEIRHDLRGKNLFTFSLRDAGVSDDDWRVVVEDMTIFVFTGHTVIATINI